MKKLMFAASVAAAMAGFAVESNIVGYGTTNTGTDPYKTLGNSFVSMTATTKANFRLGDIVLKNCSWGDDWFNFIDPATSIIDPSKDVTYYSAEQAISEGGTAEDAEWEDVHEECKDDVEYPFGTGFLCNFMSTGVEITYAGEVNADSELATIDCTGKPYAFVNNLYSGDLTFGQIKLENCSWGDDWVNFVDPKSSIVDPSRDITYYSEEQAVSEGGTADDAEWEDVHEECKDEVPLKMGEGFLCNFMSANVKIIFPFYSAK